MNRLLKLKLRPQVICGCLCQQRYSTAPVTRSWRLYWKHYKYDCLKQHKCPSYCWAVTQFRWQHTVPTRPERLQKSVEIKPDLTIRQLAMQMDVNPASLADLLIDLGEELPNGFFTVLSPELAELLVMDHDMIPVHVDSSQVTRSALFPRPPVVTIMGHVDHGKTTLLDTLRKSSVATGEAGGITQHIGAFSVPVLGAENSKTITFIDTPGHAAFETMRARGAYATDVVVLVVAADEGVKPQTVESIKHATNARVPIIVAINKVDKPKVNVEQAKQQLLQHGIQLEEFGGDVQSVEVSALKGTNLNELLEAITTLAELHDMNAKRECPVDGVVLESRKDKGKGAVATVLVRNGVLRKGSIILAGQTFAKVRLMYDSGGQVISEATPSTPVEVLGWRELPSAGDEVAEVESEHEAHETASKRKAECRENRLSSGEGHNLLLDVELSYKGDPAPKQPSGEYNSSQKLNVIIKGDVDGSIEAINDALQTYKSRKISLNVLSAEVGVINENDLKLAETFKGTVFGFNVKIPKKMQLFAKRLGITIKQHKIIYKLLEDIKDELSNRLPPVEEETFTGEAAVLKVFRLTGSRRAVVAGCRVRKGSLVRDNLYRVLRSNEVVHEGKLSTMKRGQDDISQAKRETECGLSFVKFTDIEEGDVIQCYDMTLKKQDIDWNWGF